MVGCEICSPSDQTSHGTTGIPMVGCEILVWWCAPSSRCNTQVLRSLVFSHPVAELSPVAELRPVVELRHMAIEATTVLSYDERLAEAGRSEGLLVLSPA